MAKSKKKTGFWLKLLLGINFIVIIALLLSYLSCYLSPVKFWIPAFAGLAFPYLLLANLIFVVLWLFIRLKFSLFSVLTIILGFNQIMASFQFHSGSKALVDKSYFKVISYNVRNFDLYSYDKNWVSNHSKRNNIFKFLQTESPDIICFQEFVNDLSGSFKTKDTLVTLLKAKNVHAEYTVVSRNVNEFGLATLTSFPIVHKGRIDFPNSKTNLCIYTDVLVNKDTLRIYNAHFESIHFSHKDIQFAEKITAAKADKNEQLKDKSLRIMRLMKIAFQKRAVQADLVAEHIKTSPYPVVLCTDLNDTPISYAYHRLKMNLTDAFTQSGSGFGHTYTGFYPSFRIDYILISEALQSADFSSVPSGNSDHYPVRCFLKVKPKTK
jgi:endonuclease/exonuclease/phosphatase family metal-dependent hydrolase